MLPNGDRAIVDIAKLRDYVLDTQHPRGKHKARVFASALGMTAEHAGLLRLALLQAAVDAPASLIERDPYGARYVVDFVMDGPQGSARVRSLWLVRNGEGFPRMVTCYVV